MFCAIASASTGPRFGCGAEQCGTCSVLINGEDKPSCAVEIGHAAGKVDPSRSRVSGRRKSRIRCRPLSWRNKPDNAAIVSSGILIAAKALLDRKPSPTRAEIADALAWHLCRCGAHNRIFDAVALAASRMKVPA